MGYLKIVKGKIGELEKKLEEESREADYYRRRAKELEKANEDHLEKERLMTLKYGVLITQNQELTRKLAKKKAQLSVYKNGPPKLEPPVPEKVQKLRSDRLEVSDDN